MQKLILLICLTLIMSVSSARADDIEYAKAHPKLYKYSKAFRWIGSKSVVLCRKTGVAQTTRAIADGCIWIGNKSQPYQPFINLTTAVTNAAVSTGVFLTR